MKFLSTLALATLTAVAGALLVLGLAPLVAIVIATRIVLSVAPLRPVAVSIPARDATPFGQRRRSSDRVPGSPPDGGMRPA